MKSYSYLMGVFVGATICLVNMTCVPVAIGEKTLQVMVSIVPQKYFVEKIGGRDVDVLVMVPPGAAPERYEPRPRQMIVLSLARIYFACGVPFEDVWLEKFAAANRDMLVVHTENGIEKRWMESHSHGEEGEGKDATHGAHSHEDSGRGLKDPHIWLSPSLAMLQARNILDALLKVDPGRKELYETNYRSFIAELVDLDMAIRNIFWGKDREIRFMVYHPAWGYFADAYGLKQIPVEVEGKEPKAQELERIIKSAKSQGIKVIFVQPQFSTKSAQILADAIGGRIMVADDLSEGWAENLKEVAREIATAAR